MKRRGGGILQFLSLHNPFYLLSALMMLAGCFLIVNPWGQGGRKLGDLFLSWGVLNGFEVAVIIMAIMLFRTGRAKRDVAHLVFIAFLFLFDSVFLADAFSISGGALGIYIVAISLGATAAKLAALLIGLRVRIEVGSLIFCGLCIVIVFAAPVVISQCIHAAADCEAALFYLWVAFAGIAFVFFLWRYVTDRKWQPGGVPGFWRLLVAMSFVMGAVHLIAVGLELSGGFALDYVAPLICILPLCVRCLAPSLLRKKEARAVLDAVPGILVLLVILTPSKCGERLLTDIFSYRMTVTLAFAVTGFLSLKERRPGSLAWGAVIVLLSMLDSSVVAGWGKSDLLLLFSGGLAVSYFSSVLLVRRSDRLSLSIFVAGANMLVTALFARFGMASVFVYAESTGIALLMFEFLVWRKPHPVFRDTVAGVLIVGACAYMLGEGGTFMHVFAGAQAAGFLALALRLHLRWLTAVSAAGCAVVLVKVFTFAWPQTVRGWGILLAICAVGSLVFGFWLSFKHKRLESARNSNASLT